MDNEQYEVQNDAGRHDGGTSFLVSLGLGGAAMLALRDTAKSGAYILLAGAATPIALDALGKVYT